MKFFLLILLLPVFALCQEIPKKSTTIVVRNIGLLEASQKLVDMGYMIDKKDPELGTVYTTPYAYSGSYQMMIYVRVKDSTATITGKWNVNADIKLGYSTYDMRTWNPIKYSSMSGNMDRKAFMIMDKYAKSFGKSIEYLVVK